jgi:hypothetical protein
MRRHRTSWIPLALVTILAVAPFVQCSRSSTPIPPPGVNTFPKPAVSVLRAKLYPCSTPSDCDKYWIVPRCGLDSAVYISCNIDAGGGQPPDPNLPGLCSFSAPTPPATYCQCYEGDIRYCDLNGWNSCKPTSPKGCGIQMCELGPLGQSDASVSPAAGPVPQWGRCLPPGTFEVDAGSDAGD